MRLHMIQENRKTTILFFSILLLFFALVNISPSFASGGPGIKFGTVATKGLVLGPNNRPIWVEYDVNGEKIRDIGEAIGDLENALVISAASYIEMWSAFELIEQEHGDHMEILFADEYNNRDFVDAYDNPVPKPALFENTYSVVVRTSDVLYQNVPLILLQSPLNLKRGRRYTGDAKAILLDNNRDIYTTSPVNIAYYAAFYTLDENAGSNTSEAGDGTYNMVNYTKGEHKLWGPIIDAKIETGLGRHETYTNENGDYVAQYYIPPCPGTVMSYLNPILVELRFEVFNPLNTSPYGFWYDHRTTYDHCFGVSEIPTGWGTLAQLIAKLNLMEIDSAEIKTNRKYNFTIDVAMLTGQAILGPVYLSTETEYGVNINNDKGLLYSISKEDLEKTDLYVYRMSNDQRITAREGLSSEEAPYYGGEAVDSIAAIINYRSLICGPAAFIETPQLSYEAWQAGTNMDEELLGRRADHLHVGEKVKVVLVNRATGYIGTGIAEVNFGKGPSGDNDVQSVASISFTTQNTIIMGPPNLKITAKRRYEVEKGLTAGELRENIIGAEGSGLTSDQYVTITTDWYDVDGTPLPHDLPAYTGRLAKVVNQNTLGSASGQISNFSIRPGHHTQLVKLPEENIENAHFYVHVNGMPEERNPDFVTTGAGQGPLQFRPKHYVPVKVPVFNEEATAAVAQQKAAELNENWEPGQEAPVLDDIERFHHWVYRPEMQFSLFDLEVENIEFLTEFNDTAGYGTTSMGFDYLISTYDNLDPLQMMGEDRQLLFGLGYAEIIALISEDDTAEHSEFQDLEGLMSLTPSDQLRYIMDSMAALQPEDYLGLQLYQANDAANGLFEMYGLPLVVSNVAPFKLVKIHHLRQFDSHVPPSAGIDHRQEYKRLEFHLLQQSMVSLKLYDENNNEQDTLIDEVELRPESYVFLVDYETVRLAGFDPQSDPKFIVEIEAISVDGSINQKVRYKGELLESHDGHVLGQTLVHDVMLQDGSLNLSRTDIALKGRGPQFSFSRGYNNQSPFKQNTVMGPGWSHSLDKTLIPVLTSTADQSGLPPWVNALKERFSIKSEIEIPEMEPELTYVIVNNTGFVKHNNAWHPERGRHGSLEKVGDQFIYTSKDGTKYSYDAPRYQPYTEGTTITEPTHMSIGDGIFTRLQLHPELLRLINSEDLSNFRAGRRGKIKPTYLNSIVDRNGNTMTFHYEDAYNPVDHEYQKYLVRVVDAVNRALEFEYGDISLNLFGSARRLVAINGPDGIAVSFGYNDNGLLEIARRDSREEEYGYARINGILNEDYNLIRTTDANNHSYTYDYYDVGEIQSLLPVFVRSLRSHKVVERVNYPSPHYAQFTYDATTDNRRIVRDLRGNNTTYVLNTYGNPLRIEEPGSRTTRMTWSIDSGVDDNVMLSKTDGREYTTDYEYDAKGNITRETDPYDNFILTTWNQEFSLPLTRTDRNNNTQTWNYDGNGNLQWYENGDLKRTAYTYYPTGEVETKTDPKLYVTHFTYDQHGNTDTVQGPEGSLADTDYDQRGRLVRATDPNGNVTQYFYDTLDQLTRIIHPQVELQSGSTYVQDFEYDFVGNKTRENDRNGLVLTYTHTPRNQVETITRDIGGTKTFGYDPNGNLVSETDWKNVATTHTYDALNQRDSTTNRLGHTMSMGYDLSGNLSWTEDYETRRTDYEYDRLNRLTDIYQPALENQERGHVVMTYNNEADPKTNLETSTDQEGNTTAYEYNGRYLRTKRINALLHEHVWDYDDNGNLLKETDEEEKWVDFEYDRQNRLTASVNMGTIRTEFTYDANGNQTHVIDARLKDTEIRYDAWNRPNQVIDPDEYITRTWYDGEGNVVRTQDGNDHIRSQIRDKRGLVLTSIDAENNQTTYTYDLNGNLETVTNPLGLVTTNVYDPEDRLSSVTENGGPDGTRTSSILARDRMGNPLQVQDFKGNITVTEYNALYLPHRVYDPAPFNTQYTETTYYRTGKPHVVRDRRLNPTTYEYDELNRVSRVTDALTRTVDTTYDRVGNVKTVTDKRNIITEHFYDDLHRLERTERAGTRIVTNEYDDVGNLTAVIDAENNRTEHTYNDRNLLDVTTHHDTTTESRTYDGVGNLLTHTNEATQITTYTYDRENRQETVTFAEETTQNAYDGMGNLVSVTKPRGNMKQMVYDWFSRLVRVIEDPSGLNLVTRYTYDDNNNMTHQYDPKDNHVAFTYDELNRKTSHIQHKTGGNLVTGFTLYDAEGNLKTLMDPKGQEFNYNYDVLNRQIDIISLPTGSPYYETTLVHTEYDGNNNVLSVSETKTGGAGDITDVTTNTYDDFDRLETTATRGVTVTYGYDNNGSRTLVSTTSGSTTYTFSNRNRLETANVDGQITTYTYYADGKKDTVTYPNGTDVNYNYHDTNRVSSVVNRVTATDTLISSYTYEYDSNGNRISQIEIQNGDTETTTYEYDTVDRISRFSVTGSGSTSVTDYTYDGYNRRTETVTENGVTQKSRTYDYDQTNWLTTIDDTVSGSNITYTYDSNGNTILKSDSSLVDQDIAFTYNPQNQLVRTTRGPPGSEIVLGLYDYNASGMRIRHRNSERGNVDYYYDDNAVLEEHDADTASLFAHYRYADRLLSLDTGTSTQYYHHDALGSTVNLTDQAGATQVSYKLDPWGHIRDQQGTSVNRQIFTQQEHDENTGLIYFGSRYYDPDTARFITQDSYLGESNTPPSLHRYLYAYSNPTVYIDLLGYDSIRIDQETNKVYWLAGASAGLSKVDSIVIGTYKQEGFGKGQVYLTEELGGGIVSYRSLSQIASSFHDRDGTKSVMNPKYIQGWDSDYQRTLLRDYIDDELNPHREERIIAPPEKGFVSTWVYDYEEMYQDVYQVKAGIITPGDFVMKYGYEATVGFLMSKGVGQLGNKLKGPLERIANSVGKRFKKNADEAFEEGIEYADDYVDDAVQEASGWYCERCPPASKSVVDEGGQKLITYTGDAIPTIKHHILNAFHKPTKASMKYIKFFEDRGITRAMRDQWTVEIPVTYHKEWIHKAGRNWTTTWKRWIDANPNATAKDVFQQAGKMMDEAGLSNLPLVPYN